jgi:lysophospholipid acyltransferase (LPLAT)-like uncharacterized protein
MVFAGHGIHNDSASHKRVTIASEFKVVHCNIYIDFNRRQEEWAECSCPLPFGTRRIGEGSGQLSWSRAQRR